MTPRPPTAAPPPPAPPAPPAVTPLAGADGESTGFPAYGTLVQVLKSAGPPEVYETIAGIGDITGPTTSIAEAETTSHSTGAPVRSFLPTLIDPGNLSFPCFWNPTDPTQSINSAYGLEYLFWARRVTKFQLVLPDPSHRARQFKGYVQNISEAYPTAGIATRNTAIRITSPMKDVPSPITLEPPDAAITAAGGPTTFDVTTAGLNTPWLATADQPWITVTGPTDITQGDGTVTATVAANSGVARVGHIEIAALNLSFTVNQAGV